MRDSLREEVAEVINVITHKDNDRKKGETAMRTEENYINLDALKSFLNQLPLDCKVVDELGMRLQTITLTHDESSPDFKLVLNFSEDI